MQPCMARTDDSDDGIVRFVLISSDIIRQRYALVPINRVYSKYKVTKNILIMNNLWNEKSGISRKIISNAERGFCKAGKNKMTTTREKVPPSAMNGRTSTMDVRTPTMDVRSSAMAELFPVCLSRSIYLRAEKPFRYTRMRHVCNILKMCARMMEIRDFFCTFAPESKKDRGRMIVYNTTYTMPTHATLSSG